MKTISVDEFYKDATLRSQENPASILPDGMNKDIGHFNVFEMEELFRKFKADPNHMPYNRRTYYKIALIRGRNVAEYADKVIPIEKNALLFATPKVPYHWLPQDYDQKGYFCIFTDDYLAQSKSGVVLDKLPIFSPGTIPLFKLSDEQADELALLFKKILVEIGSDYRYKFDLIRSFVMELIHYGQKLQPMSIQGNAGNASERVAALFIELLERQFPITSPHQRLSLRTAKDYAGRLAIHSNYLNKILKERTGKTTTEQINNRLVQEARILLRQTNWNISEIAYSLGFEHVSSFSNFFKKQTALSPGEIRR
jgi:AraC-like DNA-binding protein